MAEETPKVQDRLAEFFTDTGTFHSVIQKELQKRSLRNQRYEPEPGRPVANLSRESYDDGLNTIYGSGKERQTWSMLIPIDDVSLTIYGTSLGFKTPDGEGKVGFGFPNPSSQYGYLANRYQVDTMSPSENLERDPVYSGLDDNLKRKVGDVIFGEYPVNSYRPLPGLTSLSIDASQLLVNTATANLKVFSMTQVDMMSNNLLTLGKRFVMVFGYSTITQDFLKQSIFKDDKFTATPDHAYTIPIMSGGNMCYFESLLSSYDINFSADDSSFDISLSFTGQSSVALGDSDEKEKIITLDAVQKEAEVTTGEVEVVDKAAEQIIQDKSTYQKFINALERGATSEVVKELGIENIVIPDNKMLFEIGSGRETDMTSLDEDALAQTGFQENEAVTVKGSEVKKKQRHIDTHLNINRETDYPTELNYDLDGYQFPLDGKKLAVSVALASKDEEEKKTTKESNPFDTGITYIPWGLCEWILNNGIFDKEGQLEILPQKFGQYTPEESLVARDLPAVPPTEGDETTDPPIPPNPGREAVEGRYEVKKIASHINILQSCNIPKKRIKSGVDGERGTWFPRSHRQYSGMNPDQQVFDWEDDLKEDGTRLIRSTIISNHRNLFSTNPEICLLPGQIPVPEPGLSEKTIEGLTLDSTDWPPFAADEEKTLGYLRNVLINAEYFFEVVYESDLESVEILNKIWSDVNSSCGDFWEDIDANMSESPGANSRIISIKEKLPKKGQQPTKREMITALGDYYVYEEDGIEYKYFEQAFPIVNFGRDSIVREMSMKINVSSNLGASSYYEALATKDTKAENPLSSLEKIDKEIQSLKSQKEISQSEEDKITLLEKKRELKITELRNKAAKFIDYEKLLLDSAGRTLAKMKPTGNDYSFVPNIIREAEGKLMKLLTVGDFALEQEVFINTQRIPLPFEVTIKLDGISGINMNENVVFTYMPADYNAFRGIFKTKSVKHDVSDDGWVTELVLEYTHGQDEV